MSDHIADVNKKAQPTRCPHCGYHQDGIPSDYGAWEQANCPNRHKHGMQKEADHAALRARASGNRGHRPG